MNWGKQGGAAFPIPHSNEPGAPECEWGMSLRDWFAGQALAGCNCPLVDGNVQWIIQHGAANAYRIADAMLAARSAPNE